MCVNSLRSLNKFPKQFLKKAVRERLEKDEIREEEKQWEAAEVEAGIEKAHKDTTADNATLNKEGTVVAESNENDIVSALVDSVENGGNGGTLDETLTQPTQDATTPISQSQRTSGDGLTQEVEQIIKDRIAGEAEANGDESYMQPGQATPKRLVSKLTSSPLLNSQLHKESWVDKRIRLGISKTTWRDTLEEVVDVEDDDK
jgi:hypothetical protein